MSDTSTSRVYLRIRPEEPNDVTLVAEDSAATVEVTMTLPDLMRLVGRALGRDVRMRWTSAEIDLIASSIVANDHVTIVNAATQGQKYCQAIGAADLKDAEHLGKWMARLILESAENKIWPSKPPPIS